jgi:phospholipase C
LRFLPVKTRVPCPLLLRLYAAASSLHRNHAQRKRRIYIRRRTVTNQLNKVEHIVVLMLENRSFDQVLGFLYSADRPQSVESFNGLTGEESNPDDHVLSALARNCAVCDARFAPVPT